MKNKEIDFTKGPLVGPLIKFAVPVLLALLLQSLYGAVDLLVVGKFATSADVSAVATGSQLMMTLTFTVGSLAMGLTILLGQMIGAGDKKNAGSAVGTGIVFFALLGIVLSLVLPFVGGTLAGVLQAPEEAYELTSDYISICGGGMIVIILYNLIGCVFRGIGDSTTPLITVAIATVVNIIGDLALCAGFGLGTRGAAMATVFAQLVSVVLSVLMIRKKQLPFDFSRRSIRLDKALLRKLLKLGIPLSANDMLVSVSFLIILGIVNSLGLDVSAGVGVAEKVCAFIMLVPSAFAAAVAASASQNIGAGNFNRARKSLRYAVLISTGMGVLMFFINFFFGNYLAQIFTDDLAIAALAHSYLKAYAIDCLFTCFLFSMMGYFEGLGMTAFSMAQGVIGALCVRVPVSFAMSKVLPVSLFRIGLATPCATILQICMCVGGLIYASKKFKKSSKEL